MSRKQVALRGFNTRWDRQVESTWWIHQVIFSYLLQELSTLLW